MNLNNFIALVWFPVILVIGSEVYYQPQQIHLSLGENHDEIIVTWSTFNATNSTVVEYGQGIPFDLKATGKSKKFVDGGRERRFQFIHMTTLKNLKPGTRYYYHCGSDSGWSAVYSFKTTPSGSQWSPKLVVYGDLGNVNAQSLPRLQEEVQMGMYDAILHVGDFAYDMYQDNARTGDAFMRQIETIAAYLPYMTCPGNHEKKYNFTNYKNRFNMPTDPDSKRMYFSFNLGPVHIISFSTEYYYYRNYAANGIKEQYAWLENDLKIANMPENRKSRPWIITMGHRPIYCPDNYDHECQNFTLRVKDGYPETNDPGVEDLFYKYGVDLEIWAHEHSYERLWPVYNRTVYNGSLSEPYTNPKAPVHITTGSAGCKERLAPFGPVHPPWSALRIEDYGYTRMTIYNQTHLHIQQVSDDKNGDIVDDIYVIKDTHGSYF